MYYEPTDTPAMAKTSHINEDLGQIEYVFSDKTGTLTENKMEFKACSIQGKLYGFGYKPKLEDTSQATYENFREFTFNDPRLLQELLAKGTQESENIKEFLQLLSLCHTVIPEKEEDGKIRYEAASPDEEALVIAAKCFGYSFENSRQGKCTLNVMGQEQKYKIIGINEFNSTRKRMSIVIQREGETGGILLCKGADNAMFSIINQAQQNLVSTIDQQLNAFSIEGLRTLVVGKRDLNQFELQEFEMKFLNAKNAMAQRAERLEEVAYEFEVNLKLIGATAIEDKIQEGVPETIAQLMSAGVKVWVLTGDKQETAINIGYSCKLLTPNMQIIKVNVTSIDEARQFLYNNIKVYLYNVQNDQKEGDFNILAENYDISKGMSQDTQNKQSTTDHQKHEKKGFNLMEDKDEQKFFKEHTAQINTCLALIVDGTSLQYILNDPLSKKYFAMLSAMCTSVICCRVSPIQKASVVKIAKENFSFKPMTLAIGDGANDVSMIQEAHVGIGISGQEGLQAVNSSDYAIARFRFLLSLLLVHGRRNYRRCGLIICYCFYKNFVMILPMFYFIWYNAFSGTALYDSWLIMLYNMIFTALPICVLGVFDWDLNYEYALKYPMLYIEGIYSLLFNAKIFVLWTLRAVFHSVIIFFFTTFASQYTISSKGYPTEFSLSGTVAYFTVLLTVSIQIMMENFQWNWIWFVTIFGSILSFYPIEFFYSSVAIVTDSQLGVAPNMFAYFHMFLVQILVPVTCFVGVFSFYAARMLWFPTPTRIIREQQNRKSQIPIEDALSLVPNRTGQYAQNLALIYNHTKQDVLKEKLNENEYQMRKYQLTFVNKHLEKSYQILIVSIMLRFQQIMFKVIFVAILLWTIADLISTSNDVVYIVARVIVVVICLAIAILVTTRHFEKNYNLWISIIIIGAIIVKIAMEIMYGIDGSMNTAIVPIITFVIFNVGSLKILILNSIHLLVYLIRVSAWIHKEISGSTQATVLIIAYCILLLGITIINAFVGFDLEKSKRQNFVLKRQLEASYSKGQDILSTLLPRFVKDRVKQGVRYIAEDQGVVTVLFVNIYDFDGICASHTPKELMELLDGIWISFDHLCDQHGVTKIETVGKTYMACGGLKDSEIYLSEELKAKNHAVRVVELALDILKKIEPVALKNFEKLQVKIGINSGPVIAGVVGDHKPQFALVGDTVNTSSRMGSTVKHPMNIRISKSTYNLVHEYLKDCVDFKWEQVEAKGKGMLDTWLIYDKQNYIKNVLQPKTSPQHMKDFVKQASSDFDKKGQNQDTPDKKSRKQKGDASSSKNKVGKRLSVLDEILEEEENKSDDPFLNKEQSKLVEGTYWLVCQVKETEPQKIFNKEIKDKYLSKLKFGLYQLLCQYFILTITHFLLWYVDEGGTVIAGVTGSNIVRYDIYGPDVMVANLMESEGEAGRINVSQRVKDILDQVAPGQYILKYNKKTSVTLSIKGEEKKLENDCYFIEHADVENLNKDS